MNAARDILQSLRDFGWPLFAYVILAPIVTYLLPSSRSREENATRLLLGGTAIAILELSFFILTEGEQIVLVMRAHPAWGCYVVFLAIVVFSVGGKWALDRARESRKAISLISSDASMEGSLSKMNMGAYIAGIGVWLAGFMVAGVWLSKIATGQ